jgi:signal transduction histidine kinase
MELSALIRFSKLVADSPTLESVSSVLVETIVDQYGAFHALVFGTQENGNFEVLSSYGGCKLELSALDLRDAYTVPDLRNAIMKICTDRGYGFRGFPLISDAGLFGALGVVYLKSHIPRDENWRFIEGMAEMTAISLNKTHQQQKLQKALNDLRAFQDTLVRTERIRALGQLSAGIAHDLKNLLNPLQLYADNLIDEASNPEEVRDTARRIERVLARGLETVERLRNFSRLSPDESDAVPTDLNAMLDEALEITKPKLSAIELVQERQIVPKVSLRQADCVTAIVNLILNAVDAVADKGRVTVRTGEEAGGSWLEVEDNGPGIPPEIQARILEPHFTTKGSRGTGLGVSIVYAFTQRHGGRLDIHSEPGHGARFRMWFPAMD